jgi:hypothetical protein
LLESVVFKHELRDYPYTTSAVAPTTSDLKYDKDWGIHVDSNLSKVYVAYNDGGVIKKVELT